MHLHFLTCWASLKIAIDTHRHQNAPIALLLPGSAILFDAGDDIFLSDDDTNPEGGEAVNPNPAPDFVVIIIVTDLLAMQ